MGKYNNKKVYIDNLKFDSKLEADYYTYLKDNKEEFGICKIELQVPFLLTDTIHYHDKTYKKSQYKADFVITYNNGEVEVIDTKGFENTVFILKRKILLDKYKDINFWCIKKVKEKWIKY